MRSIASSSATLRAVALVAVVLLAGCSGGGGGGPTPTAGDGTTPTTASTVETATRTPTETETLTSVEGLPPGVTGEAVNTSTLVAAHDRSLADRRYATRVVLEQTLETDRGTRETASTQTTRVGASTFRTRFEQRGRGNLTQVTWGNDSLAVSRVDTPRGTTYRRQDLASVRANLSGQGLLDQFLGLGSFAVESAGDDRVVLRATGPSGESLPSNASVEGYEGRVVVAPGGRIRSANVTATLETAAGTAELSLTFEVTRLGGVTVDRPDWVRAAVAETRTGRLADR